MDYEQVFEQCEDPAVGFAVKDAIRALFEKDRQLLEVDAAERTIAARIATHLAPHFADYHVDVEYNRMGDSPKRVSWSDRLEFVFPDIIVHQRRTETNILAIEIKKNSNPEPKHDDLLKLQAYRRELRYEHALFIRFGVGKEAGSISECEWI